MGSFVSLPLLSFLALPFLSSTGTSLNLLLFTANWYILLLAHPPLLVELYGLSLVRFLFFALPSLLFLLFDSALPSVAVQVKAQGDLALSNRHARGRQARIGFWALFNTALGVGLHCGLEALATRALHFRSLLSVSKTLPLPYGMAKSVALLLAARGILQYAIHRYALHSPSSPLTALHLRWAHSLPAPWSLAAAYDHPLCYLAHHFVPLFAPAYALRAHVLPFLLALAIASLSDTVAYSGYTSSLPLLPSAILLPGMARRVDDHFLSKGRGNFAELGVLDWVLGTTVGEDVLDDVQREWEARDGDEKVREIGQGARDMVGSVKEKASKARRKSARSR